AAAAGEVGRNRLPAQAAIAGGQHGLGAQIENARILRRLGLRAAGKAQADRRAGNRQRLRWRDVENLLGVPVVAVERGAAAGGVDELGIAEIGADVAEL